MLLPLLLLLLPLLLLPLPLLLLLLLLLPPRLLLLLLTPRSAAASCGQLRFSRGQFNGALVMDMVCCWC